MLFLFDLHGPADADLELRHVVAATDPELGEEAVVVLKTKQVAAAGMNLPIGVREFAGELGNGNGRPAPLDQRPPRLAERELDDQVEVDGAEAQAVAKPAVDARAQSKASTDVGRLPGDAGVDLFGVDRSAAAEAYRGLCPRRGGREGGKSGSKDGREHKALSTRCDH